MTYRWIKKNSKSSSNRNQTPHPSPPQKGREFEGEIWCLRGHSAPQTSNFANFLRLFNLHKISLLPISFFIILALASCNTLDVSIEKTPTPDKFAISTLVALIVEATQNVTLATQVALEPTPAPDPGTIIGRICYPSEHIPAMIAYFKEIDSGQLYKFQIMANQDTYQVNLPPGQYVAYAWAASYQVGGMYSKAVPCGLTASCTDRSAQTFTVQTGQTISGIDLCDWIIPVDQLPIPPGSVLPGP